MDREKVNDDYIKVESVLHQYIDCQSDIEASRLLEELLNMIKPLIISCCRHYYGKVEEDMLQDGYEKAIRLIKTFNTNYTNVRFLGYMKRMLMCYYWDKKKTSLKLGLIETTEEQEYEMGIEEEGYRKVELKDLLNCLKPLEKEVIVRLYLMGQRQKDAARELGLSLAYIKEISAQAKKRLKFFVNI